MRSHYEERMEVDLAEIRRKVRKVSDLVEEQVRKAVQSLLSETVELANQVILGDRQVNRRIKELDNLCYGFIVRHAPSAGHLRYAAAVLRLDVALERVGDYAGMIGREVVRLTAPPPGAVRRDIELIAQQARHTLSQALQAFQAGDVGLAKATYGLADQTDLTLQTVIEELLAAGERHELPLKDVFALQRIVNLVKRVAEQSENICEQAVFASTGETKPPKVFRILFVDEHNDRSSQIAEAYARKAFPECGVYESAGWNPTKALDPGLIEFMDRQGVDIRPSTPTKLRPVADEPEHYNVIVSFSPGIREHAGKIPYRTTLLEWRHGIAPGMEPETLERLYEDVAGRIQELMTTLAGPNAR